MKKNLKRKIIIHVKDLYEKFEIINYLYNQLINNDDFEKGNIIIKPKHNKVILYIFRECKNAPSIVI